MNDIPNNGGPINSEPMTDGLPENRAADGPHHIVVVGGGAGGLELVTRLGDKLGRRAAPASA